MTTFAATSITPRIATRIATDPASLTAGSHAKNIRELLEQRGVVLFPEINLTDAQQLAFARTLGGVIEQGEKGIFKVTLDTKKNVMADYLRGTVLWHIDGFSDDVPTRASMMSARALSSVGGQTEFANTYAAFDDLPQQRKKQLEKLRVVHTMEATQPQFVYRHHWSVGDLVIWDNTGCMHRVEAYPADSGRMMHRTTLLGEEAIA